MELLENYDLEYFRYFNQIALFCDNMLFYAL